MKFAALDSRFLIRLQAGDDVCAGCIDFLRKVKLFPIATEIVRDELYEGSLNGSSGFKALADGALRFVRLDCLEPSLDDLRTTYAERCVAKHEVAINGTKNDCLVLAEAGLHEAVVLITDRKSILHSIHRIGAEFQIRTLPSYQFAAGSFRRSESNKHSKLEARDVNGPMRFWFVAPNGIIPINEVPTFAGLLVAEDGRHGIDFRIEKKAPKLHSEKFSQIGKDDIMRTAYNRYRWHVICSRSKPDYDWGIEYQI